MNGASLDQGPRKSPHITNRLLCLVAILVLAGLATTLSSSDPFEVQLVRIEAQEQLPSIAPALREESAEINALFLSYADRPALWMSAYLAMEKHGDLARQMLLEYGLLSEFQKVLVNFGADSILPIAYFYSNDLASLKIRHWISEQASQIGRWWREEESAEAAELDAHTRGLIGIAILKEKRYELLNQFDRNEEGELIRFFGESTVSAVSGFFTSGLRDLEREWRQGEAGASDFAWAGLDLLVMASAAKVLRFGKAARASRPGRISATGATVGTRSFSSLAPSARLMVVVATGYVVIQHPSVIGGLGANVARWLGWPIWLGKLLAWLIAISVVFSALALLVRPVLFLAAPLARGALLLRERRKSKDERASRNFNVSRT